MAGWLLLQMLVEPVGDDRHVLRKVWPAVPGPFLDHKLAFDSRLLQLFHNKLSLLDGHKIIGIAVDDENRRIIRRDMIHRADRTADLQDFGLIGDRPEDLGVLILFLEVKWWFEALENSPP
jgi:hypothetical protein